MKRKTSPLPLFCAAALFLGPQMAASYAGTAYAVKSGNWDSEIWSDTSGGIPSSGVRPGEGEYEAVQLRRNGIRVAIHADAGSVSQLFINNTGATTVLRLNSGARLDTRFLALGSGGGKSVLEVSGDAALTVGDTGVRVAAGENSVGTLSISEGTVTVNGAFILSGKSASGTLMLASGTLAVPFIEAGSGTAAFDWTGGALRCGGANLERIENTENGVLDIGGPDTVVGGFIQKGSAQVYRQGPNAGMRIDIEGAKSHDHFVSEGSSGQVILNGAIEIHLLKGYRPRAGDKFDIISASKIIDEGVKLGGPSGANFQAQVVKEGPGQVFRLISK